MLKSRLNDESTLGLQCLLDVAVCGLDMEPLTVAHFLCKVTLVVNGAGTHLVGAQHLVSNSNTVIVFTEGWGLVDDTCTIGVGDIGINKDPEGLVLELANQGE